MYGKLFVQMYDGTLATKGPWQAMITFQQMIILADKDGIVDMTAEVISRRSTFPLEHVLIGIDALEQADPGSRTPDHDGRRIVRLDEHRDWGWQIVNHAHYRKIRSEEERREYQRDLMRKRRAAAQPVSNSVSNVSDVSPCSKQYAVSSKHKSIVGINPDATPLAEKEPKGKTLRDSARRVIECLNKNAGRRYEPVDANLGPIIARLREGYSEQELRAITAVKARQWKGDEKMMAYIRPKTLYNASNAAQYRAELPANQIEEVDE